MGIGKSKIDVDKLQAISDILSEVSQLGLPGEHFVDITLTPSMNSGWLSFLLHWKCENGELNFRNLDEAILGAKAILRWAQSRDAARKRSIV